LVDLRCLVGQFVQLSGSDVLVNLVVPLLVEVVLQPIGDFSGVFNRKRLQSLFDFNHCTHW